MEPILQYQYTLRQQTEEALNALLRRAQAEMSEHGTFAPMSEKFRNSDPQFYCGDVCMTIKYLSRDYNPSETKYCFDLIVKTPSGQSTCSCYLFCGTKVELLDHISNEAFCDELLQKVKEMANELRTDKFA